MAKVHRELLAPNGQPLQLACGEIARKGQGHVLIVVTGQRLGGSQGNEDATRTDRQLGADVNIRVRTFPFN